jgi:hypothetical protein
MERADSGKAAIEPNASQTPAPEQPPYTPTRDKDLPPTSGKARACSARFMAKFRELVNKGLNNQQLVDELCIQEREIYALRSVLEIKEEIEQKVQSIAVKVDTDFDRIRPTHYIQLARVPDAKKRLELAQKVAEENLSVQELKREIEGPPPKQPPREEAVDTGPWTCPVCKQNYRLLHHPNGRHEFEPVEVIEK